FISAVSGDYRVRELMEKGKFVYEKCQDNHVEISYTFALEPVHEQEVNHAKDLVTERSESPFNKGLLMTKTTQNGHKTLTDSTFTIVENGEKTKQEINEHEAHKMSKCEFDID